MVSCWCGTTYGFWLMARSPMQRDHQGPYPFMKEWRLLEFYRTLTMLEISHGFFIGGERGYISIWDARTGKSVRSLEVVKGMEGHADEQNQIVDVMWVFDIHPRIKLSTIHSIDIRRPLLSLFRSMPTKTCSFILPTPLSSNVVLLVIMTRSSTARFFRQVKATHIWPLRQIQPKCESIR